MIKIHLYGRYAALGVVVALGGCAAVPGPGYSDGYYSSYPGSGPVYVQPAPVYIDGGYSSGPRYWDDGRHYGHRPGYAPQRPIYVPQRPAYVPQRPGYVPQRPAYVPGPGFDPRPGVTPPPATGPAPEAFRGRPPGPQVPGGLPRDPRLIKPFPSESVGGS